MYWLSTSRNENTLVTFSAGFAYHVQLKPIECFGKPNNWRQRDAFFLLVSNCTGSKEHLTLTYIYNSIVYSYIFNNISVSSCPFSFFFLTEHHAVRAYWGSVGIAPRILDLGTRWR
jgi:hypothetical protein